MQMDDRAINAIRETEVVCIHNEAAHSMSLPRSSAIDTSALRPESQFHDGLLVRITGVSRA